MGEIQLVKDELSITSVVLAEVKFTGGIVTTSHKKNDILQRIKKYLFLFFDIIQSKCPKYWLNFYFKSGKCTGKQ